MVGVIAQLGQEFAASKGGGTVLSGACGDVRELAVLLPGPSLGSVANRFRGVMGVRTGRGNREGNSNGNFGRPGWD